MPLIKCPECHKKVSSTVEKCIHCGYDIASINNEQLSTSTSKTKHNKVIVPIVVGVTVVVALSITVTQILSPKSRFERAMSSGDISSAVSIYCNNETNSKFVTFADQRISEYLEEVVQAYGAGTSSWANALANCDVLSRAVDTHYYTERIDNISESKSNYLKGVECDANGDIIGAFSAFTSITEDDTQNYSDARNWIDTKGKEYIDSVVAEADHCAAKHAYEDAANLLKDISLAVDDPDVMIKYIEYQTEADKRFVDYNKKKFDIIFDKDTEMYFVTIYNSGTDEHPSYAFYRQNMFPCIFVRDDHIGFGITFGFDSESQIITNTISIDTSNSQVVLPIARENLDISDSRDEFGFLSESCFILHNSSPNSDDEINLKPLIDSFDGAFEATICFSGSRGEKTFDVSYHDIKDVRDGWRLYEALSRNPSYIKSME